MKISMVEFRNRLQIAKKSCLIEATLNKHEDIKRESIKNPLSLYSYYFKKLSIR